MTSTSAFADPVTGAAPAGRAVEAEWAPAARPGSDLDAFYGPDAPVGRAPRVLGLFAHPDDAVFCFGATIARCAAAGAVTAVASLTHGEAGQIRDASTATRRSLGPVRVKELEQATSALGVDHVTCLDLGDGRLGALPLQDVAATARSVIDQFDPDVVVTFGPDGGFGHPDHVMCCLATGEAVRAMPEQPRLLHAKFPVRGQLMLELLVDWLVAQPRRSRNTAAFCNALKLFAVSTSMLGVSADAVQVEWYPPGSYIVEQGEIASELFCILSGTVDIAVEGADGSLQHRGTPGVGDFFGEVGIATGRPRGAHVIARDAVTCLVFAREEPSLAAGRGAGSNPSPGGNRTAALLRTVVEDCLMVNVRPALERKVQALSAHRSQYALEPGLLPRSMMERLLGTERFVVTDIAR